MITRKDSKVLAAMSDLSNDLLARLNGASFRTAISLSQALDRLYLSYQSGQCTDSEAIEGINEIRSSIASESSSFMDAVASTVSNPLRDETRQRNAEGILSRFLSQSDASYDDRQLELLQSLINEHATLSMNESDKALIAQYHEKLSNALWSSARSTDESSIRVQDESEGVRRDLRELSQTHHFGTNESLRELALEKALDFAHLESQAALLRQKIEESGTEFSKLNAAALNLKAIEDEILTKREAWEEAKSSLKSEADAKETTQIIQEASVALQRNERKKLDSLAQRLVHLSAGLTQSEGAKDLLEQSLKSIQQKDLNQATRSVSQNLLSLMSLAQSQGNSQEALNLAQLREEVESIRLRGQMAKEIETFDFNSSTDTPNAPEETNAYLSARTLFQQQLMKFEQSQWQAEISTNLLKALDFEVPLLGTHSLPKPEKRKPQQASNSDIPWKRMYSELKKVEGLAQSAAANDVGFVATNSVAVVKNAKTALEISDSASPMASNQALFPNESQAKLAKLINSVQQLAYSPSMRTDMGFAGQRYRMDDNTTYPLFKRVSYNRNDESVKQILPTVYKVAGLRSKGGAGTSTPLRKAFKGLDLSGANLEIVKILEEKFDDKQKARFSDNVSSISHEPGQTVKGIHSEIDKLSTIASEWIERREKSDFTAETKSLVDSGSMDAANVESSLRSEAQPLPTSVQAKLAPYLGFDLSKIKIFSGPIADMASTAMGAHAFTLGKNIFFAAKKLQLDSPEGLGLLAHELLHTAHFSSGDSVGKKEQAAESMEERVKKAFSSSTRDLALETPSSKKSSEVGNQGLKSGVSNLAAPQSVGKHPKYDMDNLVDHVTEMLTDWMSESFDQEKQRKGE